MSEKEFDVIIIGAGPGGYVCAVRCAQLGLKVAIVEKRKTLGGTCLNVGCIPSKALLDSSERYENTSKHLDVHGISVSKVGLDLKKLLARKDKVVSEVCNGVDYLMKKNKIKRILGSARLKGKQQVEILESGKVGKVIDTLSAKKIVIASGSVPIEIPGLKVDGKNIVTSDHAINLPKVPKHLIIIGSGVIGLELGSVWRRLGAKVTIVELMPRLMGKADKQVSGYFERILTKQGFNFMFDHKVQKAEVLSGKDKGKIKISALNKKDEPVSLEGDVVLVAVGRRPVTENLGLEKAEVMLTDRGRIKVDSHSFATSASGIYAIGDVTDGPMLAHKAEEEGVALAEMLAGQSGHVNYAAIPYIVYTWPEMAWVGFGEEELKERGVAYKVGKAYFKANGRAKAMNENDGMVKILADKTTDKLLGLYVVGAHASDMIAEAAIAFEFGASSEDLARSIHAHPTLAEVIKDAAQSVDGWAIHA